MEIYVPKQEGGQIGPFVKAFGGRWVSLTASHKVLLASVLRILKVAVLHSLKNGYAAENSGISVLAFAHFMTQRKQHIL